MPSRKLLFSDMRHSLSTEKPEDNTFIQASCTHTLCHNIRKQYLSILPVQNQILAKIMLQESVPPPKQLPLASS